MRPKTALKKLKPLLIAPSFTSKEASKYSVSSATLAHYVKQGDLQRIGHGVYRGVNSPVVSEFRWEDLAQAVQRVRGGVVCLTSALVLHGLTEELPRQHWIAIRNDTGHRADTTTKIIRMRNLELGKSKIDIGGVSIPIFDRERTVVDAFRYLSQETAIKALRAIFKNKSTSKTDIKKLLKYAKILRVKIKPYLLAVTT